MRPTFQPKDWIAYSLLSLLQLTMVVWVFHGWFRVGQIGGVTTIFIILTLLLVMFVAFLAYPWLVLPSMKDPVYMAPSPGWKVGVVTSFVPGSESLDMLERTLRGLVNMDYPHDTWVLDEGDNPEVKRLCKRLGVNHWSRKGKPHYHTGLDTTFQARSKHGNYNAFFDEIGYDAYQIIVGFDTDHVPTRHYLTRVLGYFDDPEIGYVQGAQIYYNQEASFIARGAAEETYGYYSCTMRSGNSRGHPIIVGCHQSHRVEALKQAGGFAAHDADDMLLTFHYCRAGWRGVYVPEPLAEGLTPADWMGYLQQQRRWARSVLDLKFRGLREIRGCLPLADRIITYLQGFSYLQGLVTFMGTIALVYILFTGETPAFSEGGFFMRVLVLSLVAWAASFYYQRFSLCRRERGLHWRSALIQFAKWPILLVTFFEALAGRHVEFTLTPKGSARKSRRQYLSTLPAFWPHYATAALVAAGLVVTFSRPEEPYLGVLIWGVVMIIVSLAVVATTYLQPARDYDPAITPALADEDTSDVEGDSQSNSLIPTLFKKQDRRLLTERSQ